MLPKEFQYSNCGHVKTLQVTAKVTLVISSIYSLSRHFPCTETFVARATDFLRAFKLHLFLQYISNLSRVDLPLAL